MGGLKTEAVPVDPPPQKLGRIERNTDPVGPMTTSAMRGTESKARKGRHSTRSVRRSMTDGVQVVWFIRSRDREGLSR